MDIVELIKYLTSPSVVIGAAWWLHHRLEKRLDRIDADLLELKVASRVHDRLLEVPRRKVEGEEK